MWDLAEYSGWVVYFLVFLMGAAVEVVIAIPIGIAVNLNPFTVSIAAFLGNAVPTLIIIYIYDAYVAWKNRQTSIESGAKPPSKRKQRARKLLDRFGLPGLAILGPLITGTHIATALALAMGCQRNRVLIWMLLSLVVWTVVTAVAFYYSFEVLLNLLGGSPS